jgi:hypothetical protein
MYPSLSLKHYIITLKADLTEFEFSFYRFPAEVVRVDVSGKNFMRMSNFRRSLMHVELEENGLRKRGKNRRPRGKRRNTIAGTDSKELEAIVGLVTTNIFMYIYNFIFRQKALYTLINMFDDVNIAKLFTVEILRTRISGSRHLKAV